MRYWSSFDKAQGDGRPHHWRAIWLPICLAMGLQAATACLAQVPGSLPDVPGLTDAERRESTLRWLDSFLTESNLLRPEDTAQIRDAVLQMSTSQLEQWLAQTRTLREYVESEPWQRTRIWLREFLRVQNVYGEEELQRMREELINADADEMLAILKRIQARHDRLAWMHAAAEQQRQFAVRGRDLSMAEQAAANEVARTGSGQSVPVAVEGGEAPKGGSRTPRGTVIPSPLINSREVARVAVWNEIWGGGWFFGF